MAEQAAVSGECQRFRIHSELDSARNCVNCICLQSQLSKALEELKSLQTIISLLQKDSGPSYTDLAQSEHCKIDLSDERDNQTQNMVHDNGQSQKYNCTQNWKCVKYRKPNRR
jgi:hypothetical protein